MTLEEKTYKELCKQIVDRTNRPPDRNTKRNYKGNN